MYSAREFQDRFINAFCDKLETNNRRDLATISDYVDMTLEIFDHILNEYVRNNKNLSYPLSRFSKNMQKVLQSTIDTSTTNKLKIIKLYYKLYDIFAKRIIEEKRLINEDSHQINDEKIVKFCIIDSLYKIDFFNKILFPIDITALNDNINISKFILNINIVNANMYLDNKNDKLYYYFPDSASTWIMRYISWYINNQLQISFNSSSYIDEFVNNCLIKYDNIEIKDQNLKETFCTALNFNNTLFICGLLSKGLNIIEKVFIIDPNKVCNDKNEIIYILAPLYLAYYLTQYKKDTNDIIAKNCAERFINKYLPLYKQKAATDKNIKKFINDCTQNYDMFDVLKTFKVDDFSTYQMKDFINWFNNENILLHTDMLNLIN